MSEQDKGDGFIIGILVVLAMLVIGGLGVVGLGFFRASRVAIQERDMAEAMRYEAEQQRAVAEAARTELEAARAQLKAEEPAASESANPVTQQDKSESKEEQP